MTPTGTVAAMSERPSGTGGSEGGGASNSWRTTSATPAQRQARRDAARYLDALPPDHEVRKAYLSGHATLDDLRATAARTRPQSAARRRSKTAPAPRKKQIDELLCESCYLRKPATLFEPGSTSCRDCELG
jgi:hypothetical protein